MVPQLSPVTTPKWQTGWPARHDRQGSDDQQPAAGQDVVDRDVGGQRDRLPVGDLVIGGDGGAVGGVVPERRMVPMTLPSLSVTGPLPRQWPAVNATRVCGSTNPSVQTLVPCRISIPGETTTPGSACAAGGERDARLLPQRAGNHAAHGRLRSLRDRRLRRHRPARTALHRPAGPDVYQLVPECEPCMSTAMQSDGPNHSARAAALRRVATGSSAPDPGWIRSGLATPLASAITWYLLPSP